MSDDKKYNGWTNETWNVNLWITDDSSDYWEEEASNAIQSAIDHDRLDIREEATSTLRESIKDHFENAMADILEESKIQCSMWADLLGAALSEVNWHEIAEHFVNDIELWTAGWNMAGYMPDSTPAIFRDFDDAKQYVIEEMNAREDDAKDESLAEELCHAAEYVNLESSEFGVTIGGYHYFVTKNAE